MLEETERPQSVTGPDVEIEPLRVRAFVFEILCGIGIALGLGLLWVMEVIRNFIFHLLDWANFRPHTRRPSAFPPGQPRKHAPLDVHP
jgi:hypothetical protein